MKVVLLSRNSNHRVTFSILDKYSDEFLDIFRNSRSDALSVILDDVGIFRLGLIPKFIGIGTAKRLDSFFSPNTTLCTGNLIGFYRLESVTL